MLATRLPRRPRRGLQPLSLTLALALTLTLTPTARSATRSSTRTSLTPTLAVAPALNPHPNQVCCQKLNKYLTRFQLAPRFTTAEFRHWMLTRSDVVYSYVVEDPETKEITDMVSSCHT